MSGTAVDWRAVADGLLRQRQVRERLQAQNGVVRAAARVIRAETGLHHNTARRIARALQDSGLLTIERLP